MPHYDSEFGCLTPSQPGLSDKDKENKDPTPPKKDHRSDQDENIAITTDHLRDRLNLNQQGTQKSTSKSILASITRRVVPAPFSGGRTSTDVAYEQVSLCTHS
jgi:hypothetical protein